MAQETQSTEGRALLTDTERAALAGDRSDSYRYKTRSYLKRRIEKLEQDVEVLAEHAPKLLADVQAAVDAGDTQPPRETQGAGEPTPDLEGDQSPTDTDRPTRAATEDASPDTQPFDGVEFPTGKDREQCVEAINAAREYLRAEGPATMREIVSAVHPDYPLGYDVDAALAKVEAGERYRGAWWRRIVKPGLDAAGDVQSPAPGQSDYRYTGGDR